MRTLELAGIDLYTLVFPGSMQRIFFGISCGQDHVAAESSRLLLRLFAPAAGRGGTSPWTLPKADTSAASSEANNSAEDASIAQQAKMIALKQPGRQGSQISIKKYMLPVGFFRMERWEERKRQVAPVAQQAKMSALKQAERHKDSL